MGKEKLALQVEDLVVSFGGRAVLRQASFRLREGEVVGLVGRNGSGKTTILNALSGFVAASGAILLDGIEIGSFKPWQRSRAGVLRTVQRGRWSNRLSQGGTQEVRRWCRRLAPSEGTTQRLCSTVKSAFFHPGVLLPPEEGDRIQRARRDVEEVFAARPRVVLLDEPLAGESPAAFRRLDELLGDLRKAGNCGIIVEHRIGLLSRLVDGIWEVRDGVVLTS